MVELNPERLFVESRMVGGELLTVKSAVEAARPTVVCTVMAPADAPAGTVALIWVPPPETLATAETPLNLTTGAQIGRAHV